MAQSVYIRELQKVDKIVYIIPIPFFKRSFKLRVKILMKINFQSIQIFAFVGISIYLTVYSFNINRTSEYSSSEKKNEIIDESKYESFFTMADYYILKNGKKFLKLNAKELVSNSRKNDAYFMSPKGTAFGKNGEPIFYKGDSGSYLKTKGKLNLKGNVFLRSVDSELLANDIDYDTVKSVVYAIGDIDSKNISVKSGDKIFITSDKLTYFPDKKTSFYLGNVKGKVVRKRIYEEKFFFDSDRLDLNMITLMAELNGNVHVRKQGLRAKSLKGEIFLENYNKKLKYFVLYDDVKVVERVVPEGANQQSFIRKAFAEKMEGIMSEDRIILTGFPKVIQHSDIIKGNRIVLRQDTEVVEVEDANSNFNVR